MNYNFTDRVRTVLAMARKEAVRLQHSHVGTEHVPLGLLREGQGVGVDEARAKMVEILGTRRQDLRRDR